jgi:hypothetical protein
MTAPAAIQNRPHSLALMGLLLAASADCAAYDVKCNEGRCQNEGTSGFAAPAYRSIYSMNLVTLPQGCTADQAGPGQRVSIPKNTYFRESLDKEAQTAESLVVNVYEVDQDGSEEATKEKYFSRPLKLCLRGEHAVPRSYYRRVGGFNTGVLVVPFKLRRGDIFSDSTIGPYLSYKWELVEVNRPGFRGGRLV